jgi:Domain of unknown function (DUF6438)
MGLDFELETRNETVAETCVAAGHRYAAKRCESKLKTASFSWVRASLVATLCLPLAACATGGLPPHASMTASPGPLQLEFELLTPRESNDISFCPDSEQKTGVTEISLERTGCYGYCPMYTVTLRSNGRASYEGRANVKHVGKFSGSIPVASFEFLAKVALELGAFDRLPSDISCAITDNPTVFLALARDGERRVISHYAPGRAGPASLALLEQAIDIFSDQIAWKRVNSP